MSKVDKILTWIQETDQNPENQQVNFKHDPWCTIFQDKKTCTCIPDVYIADKKINWEKSIQLEN